MKYIIFDSGPLINFSMNNLLYLLKRLKKEFPGKFLITKEVKEETIDYPETVKRFKLGALQLQDLFNKKVIELPILTKEQEKELIRKRDYIMTISNSTFSAKGKNLHLIDKGEAAALALAVVLSNNNKSKKSIAIAVDERTTRMLCENPENLRKLLQKKLKTSVKAKKEQYHFFKQFKIIRSTELIFVANKKKLFDLKDPRALEAMLYGLKYKGCSISEEEVRLMTKL